MNYSYWELKHFLADIDFLVVGMGLVGLQTAIHIKEEEPKAKVVVIDRHSWGLGASTRNAGFACFANVSEILDDLQNDSPENVYRIVRNRYKGLQKLRTKFGDSNLGYAEKGSVEVFTAENKTSLTNGIDSLKSINTILYTELGLDNVFQYRSNANTPRAIGAIHNQFEGQLHTGKMYNSIYQYAQLLGIKLWGGIEVSGWQGSDIIEVMTKDGLKLHTKNLILCTNAFTSNLLDEDIAPCRGQVIVSEVLDKLPCKGIYNYDKGYYYWRDIDNRILLGGARNLDLSGETSQKFEQNDIILAELKRFMKEYILDREVRIDYTWSGIMGLGNKKQKTPIVKKVDSQIFLAARLGGMGVALSASVAEDVKNLVLRP